MKMKKSVLSISLACALGLSTASVYAYQLEIDGQPMEGANVSGISVDADTVSINTVQGSAKIGLVDGTSNGSTGDGTKTDNDSHIDEGANTDDGNNTDDTAGSGTCSDAPSNVYCGEHLADWPSERENSVTAPAGKILSSSFTLGDGLEYGSISFQAYHSRVADVWISASPGGPALNDSRCSRDSVSFYFVVKWSAFEWNQACSLEPGGTYYLNLKSQDSNSYSISRAVY